MAGGVPAGRLSIEIVAEIARLQSDLDKAKRAVAAASGDIAKSARHANDNLSNMSGGFNKASGSARGFALQFSQVGQQVMAGTGLIQALAMQLPDIAAGMNAGSASGGKFAAFLGGPWGIAITSAIGLAATFAVKLLDTDDASKKAEKGQRGLVDVLRDSKGSWADVTKAAKDYADQQQKNRQLTINEIKVEALAIKSRLDKARAIREELAADLEAYEALTRRGAQSESGDVARQGAFARADRSRAALEKNAEAIKQLGRAADETAVKYADFMAKINNDPAERIRSDFDALEQRTRSQVKGARELATALSSIGAAEQAALKEAGEANRRHADETIRLAKVTGAEIAKALGAPITSGLRSKSVNDSVKGAKNSYHLTGQAIDIPLSVGGRPFTKEGIRSALAPLGVQIKELLGPGDKGHNDHFHIAFGLKRLAPDQVRGLQEDAAEAARKAAAAAEDEMQKFRLRVLETSIEMGEAMAKAVAPGLIATQQKEWAEFDETVRRTIDGGLDEASDAMAHLGQIQSGWNEELVRTIDYLDQIGTNGRALGDIGGALLGLTTGDFRGSRGPLGGILQTLGNTQWRGPADANGLGQIKILREEIVNGLDEVFGGKGTFANTMTDVLKGAGTGAAIGSVLFGKSQAAAFGSTAGGALGQAAGAELGKSLTGFLGSAAGPLGSIIGSLAGGVLGGLLQKTKKGSATFTEAGLSGTSGNSGSRITGAKNAGSSALDAFQDILTRLDATAANIKFSTGIRKESFVLDPTGAGRTKGAGVLNFGKDEAAYMEGVVREIFADASFEGLSAGFSKLLKSGGDIEKQVEKVFALKGAFDELASIKDPMGFALGNLDKEFDKLRGYAVEAGEGLVEVEELYGLKRKAILEKNAEDTLELERTRRGMEAELLRLSGDEIGALAIARQLEREQLDPSLQALYDQTTARQDEIAALEKVTAAQEAARLAAEAAAQAAAEIEKQRINLRIEILDEQGRAEEALALRRQQQRDETDALLQADLDLLFAAQDAAKAVAEQAAATQAAAEIEKARTSLRIELLEAQGRAEEALALRQQQQLAGLDPLLHGLQEQVWAAQKAAEAQKALTDAQVDQQAQVAAAFNQTASIIARITSETKAMTKSLREYADSIFGREEGNAQARYLETVNRAAAGDRGALAALPEAITAYLDQAKGMASSLADYQIAAAYARETAYDVADVADARARRRAMAMSDSYDRESPGYQRAVEDMRNEIADLKDTIVRGQEQQLEIGIQQVNAIKDGNSLIDNATEGGYAVKTQPVPA